MRAALTALFCSLPMAQVQLEVTDVPEHLVFPLPSSTNTVITVTVHGAADSVWLATTPQAKSKHGLTPTGPGRYQLNLASHAVTEFLRNAGLRGEFAVHATAGDAVVSSVPVRYSFLDPHPTSPMFYVYGDGTFRSGLPGFGTNRWFDAATTTRIEWYFARTDRIARMFATASGRQWPFILDKKRRLATLIVTAEVRETWDQAGALTIQHGERSRFELKARPARLRLRSDPERFSLVQRRRMHLPGSRRWLEVSIGDITLNQVMLTVTSAEGETIVPSRSVTAGDRLRIPLAKADYVLTVSKLVNVVIGDDFAELALTEADDAQRSIGRILARIAAAKVTFLREGERYDGVEAAAHLRAKLAASRTRIETVDDFIEHIASRSSITGSPYLIETADGTRIKAADWLKQLEDRTR